ncbi:MAG: hypothetical protein ABI866_09560 [Dokdonella sp.]
MSRLIHARMFLALAIAVTIGALELGSMKVPKSATATKQQIMPVAADEIPTLSTVRVSAQEQIPMLPLVIVRPLVAQETASVPLQALASIAQHTAPLSGSGLPHVRLDMPYYSFGKMLPNVIKD